MPTLIEKRRPTARAEHRCFTCRTLIHPGTVYVRATYVYDGRIYDIKTCTRCEEILPDVCDWHNYGEEGVGPEDFYEWAREAVLTDKHPAWGPAVDFLARLHYATTQETP